MGLVPVRTDPELWHSGPICADPEDNLTGRPKLLETAFQRLGYPLVRALITLAESPSDASQLDDKGDALLFLSFPVDGP